jgi:ATP-dependent Clp protease ATP-binding subunit ClpB
LRILFARTCRFLTILLTGNGFFLSRPDRQQPDKSIDLVDEACSRLRLEQESKPEIIWKVERDLMTRQIELSALENEQDADVKVVARRAECQNEVAGLKAEVKRLTDMWLSEKKELTRVQDKKGELEKARMELEAARRRGDFAKAGELLHGTIPRLEHELDDLEHSVDNGKKDRRGKMLADSVSAEAIATIIARHTGIPVSRIAGDESQKLLHMEDKMRERVVGQDHALRAVSNCVRLARTRLQSQNRTLGNFLFLGPTVRPTGISSLVLFDIGMNSAGVFAIIGRELARLKRQKPLLNLFLMMKTP